MQAYAGASEIDKINLINLLFAIVAKVLAMTGSNRQKHKPRKPRGLGVGLPYEFFFPETFHACVFCRLFLLSIPCRRRIFAVLG